jgi:sugar phosphate isomerase/epimerase
MPFGEIFQILSGIGYRGYITAEILPRPDPDAAARQAIRFLRARAAAAATV